MIKIGEGKELLIDEFFDGIVALKKYEDKGVSVNLAPLYRRLRDFFK